MEMVSKLPAEVLSGYRVSMGLFRCSVCGREVVRRRVNGKKQRSCGCSADAHKSTHGFSSHPLYGVWSGIVQRCEVPSRHEYPRYGGRGISMCREWRLDASAFIEWAMKNGWEKGLHVDRIDNDLGYSPENCRIVTARQNDRNRKTNKLSFEKAETIRRMHSSGLSSQRKIAEGFGVHPSIVSMIVTNKIWLPTD